MRFVYVAKHDQPNSNDDEGGIAHALVKLGHSVTLIHEKDGRKALKERGDVLLFHKWSDPPTLARLEGRIIRAFWYFDLVDYPDKTIAARCNARKMWMRQTTPNIDIGFCTDGDWVKQDRSGKLVHLMQGADERILGYVEPPPDAKPIKVLLAGTQKGGTARHSFVALLKTKLGDDFHHVENGVYREAMAELVGRSNIVLCPDSPITDSYWSNRIYMMLGFGAFLMHPFSHGVRTYYKDGEDLIVYQSRLEMMEQINYWLNEPVKRRVIAAKGLARTVNCHTYRNRCDIMCTHLERLVWEQKKW